MTTEALHLEIAHRALARRRRVTLTIIMLALALVALYVVSLCVGDRTYSISQVLQVITGQQVPGASFTVGELRLPRATTAVLTGFAFGVAGVCFQALLRNQLASPDIIGITAGANTSAVAGIIVFGLSGPVLSAFSVAGGLITALLIAALAWGRGGASGRLILIGIAVSAMFDAVTMWLLVNANQWEVQNASRWMTGSLNNASWETLTPLAIALLVTAPALAVLASRLQTLRLGDETAAALGVHVMRTRISVMVVAVLLLALATATTGPIAFVSFLAGPIAMWMLGPSHSPVFASGLVGAVLVLASDFTAAHLLPHTYPVGVVTGALGGVLLIVLLIRSNRKETHE